MDEVARMVFLFIVAAASVVAFFVVLEAFFHRRLMRTQSVAEAMPGRALLVGLVNFAFFGGAAVALLGLADRVGSNPLRAILTIPALIILVVLGASLSLGLGGVVRIVSERLTARAQATSGPDSSGADWKRTASGALVLGLACLAPFVGWFLMLPYVALLGLGALILGLIVREPPNRQE